MDKESKSYQNFMSDDFEEDPEDDEELLRKLEKKNGIVSKVKTMGFGDLPSEIVVEISQETEKVEEEDDFSDMVDETYTVEEEDDFSDMI